MSNTNGLMILGAGVMQIPALKAAKRLKLDVTVVDASSQAPGISLAQNFLAIDLKNKEEIFKAASKISNLQGIMTAGTDFSVSVAYVAEKLGLPGISYETALRATHKGLMRKCFEQNTIPSPSYFVYENGNDIKKFSHKLKFPCVIKPVDNMGARGVRKIYDKDELEKHLNQALDFSRIGQVIIEEYMEGPEFSLDALIYNGHIQVCGIADRHITFDPYFIEMGHTMPSSFPPHELKKIEEIFIKGIKALGITMGAAKGDIKLTPSGPMIGEIAARLSGGYMSGWTYPYSSGIDLSEAAIKIALGINPGILIPPIKMVSAERAFISIPGKIKKIKKLGNKDKIFYEQGIKEIFYRIQEGDRVVFPHNNVEKCGNIISQAPNREKATELCRKMINNICIHLELQDPESESFLYTQNSTCFPPPCIDISGLFTKMGIQENSFQEASKPDRISGAIMPLEYGEIPEIKDWYGNTLSEILSLVEAVTPVKWDKAGDVYLSWAFWHSILRGGLQGAIYTLESYKAEGNQFLKRIYL